MSERYVNHFVSSLFDIYRGCELSDTIEIFPIYEMKFKAVKIKLVEGFAIFPLVFEPNDMSVSV